MKIISFIEDVGLLGGLLRDNNNTPCSSDGFDFCYLSAVFDNSKELQYDNHSPYDLRLKPYGKKEGLQNS
jgi:hypothetical protein